MSATTQPKPKPYQAWLLSNHGLPVTVERTRREAIEYAEYVTCFRWREIRNDYAVCKVQVTPL